MRNDILVVDDDRFLADAIKKLFEGQGYDVSVANSGSEAIESLSVKVPHFAILDLGLPDVDGISLCQQIRAKHSFPILILTSRDEAVDKVIGLGVGADDYLTKPFDARELVARARALIRRASEYSSAEKPKATVCGPLNIDAEARVAALDERILDLTETEFKVLNMLAANKGNAISRDSLFDTAWGYEIGFNSNSLEVIIYRLRNKIRGAGGPDMIQTMRGFGYKLDC